MNTETGHGRTVLWWHIYRVELLTDQLVVSTAKFDAGSMSMSTIGSEFLHMLCDNLNSTGYFNILGDFLVPYLLTPLIMV